jgi:hypothetical protein
LCVRAHRSFERQNVTSAGTTRQVHDHADRIIAELNAAGNDTRFPGQCDEGNAAFS